jgi:hypothetical protein
LRIFLSRYSGGKEMWKLVKGEFLYARIAIAIVIAFMAFCGFLGRLVSPLKPANMIIIMPVIYGLCLLLSWLMSMKQQKRDVLIARLPVSNTEFAIFRILTPVIWYIIVIGYYLLANQFLRGYYKIHPLIYSSLLWPMFHIGYSITSDILTGLTTKPFSRLKGSFWMLITIAMMAAILYGSYSLAGWLFPNLVYEDIFQFFMYLVLFIILSAVSVFTYGRRTRFV